ncbi:hypothetical protein DFH07DRAFT_953291 [Mycena maculata]|uniref:Uncharacterized protein n=1 Tax=Mycena maculata TaxID=230809 RepID=A0AAD7JWW0_9AGAR|nr:hypothetical protein DFH07DRAFT_953291 [Mycena maculata]
MKLPILLPLLFAATAFSLPTVDPNSLIGVDPNLVVQSCSKQIHATFATPYDATRQGIATGKDSSGRFFTLKKGEAFAVPNAGACQLTVTNAGTAAYSVHSMALQWEADFITDRCPTFTNTNVQQGLTASWGGIMLNLISYIKYDLAQ